MMQDVNDPGEPTVKEPATKPPLKRRLGRWLAVIAVVLVLLLGLLLAFAPHIASTGPARGFVVGYLNDNLNGRIEIGTYDLSWADGITATDVRLYDEADALVLHAPAFSTNLSLWSALTGGRLDLGDTRAEVNLGRFIVYEEGDTNLQRILAPLLDAGEPTPPDGRPTEAEALPTFNLQLVLLEGSTIEVPAAGSTVRLARSTVQAALAERPEGGVATSYDIDLTYAVNGGEAGRVALVGTAGLPANLDPLSAQLQTTLRVEGADLAATSALARLAGLPADLAGRLSGELKVQADTIADLQAAGRLTARNLVIATTAADGSTEPVSLDSAELDVDVARASENGAFVVLVNDVRLTTPVLTAAVTGRLVPGELEAVLAGTATAAAGTQLTLTANDADLAALQQILRNLGVAPEVLAAYDLRDGRGGATVEVTGTTATGSLRAEGLVAAAADNVTATEPLDATLTFTVADVLADVLDVQAAVQSPLITADVTSLRFDTTAGEDDPLAGVQRLNLQADVPAYERVETVLAALVPDFKSAGFTGGISLTQALTRQGSNVRLAGSAALLDAKLRDEAGDVVLADRRIELTNDLLTDADLSAVNLDTLRLAGTDTRALELSAGGTIRQLQTQPVFDEVVVDVAYDLAQLKALLLPLVDEETRNTLADVELAGQRSGQVRLSGTYASQGPDGQERPFNEAIRSLRATGNLGADRISAYGATVTNLELPFLLENGVLQLIDSGGNQPAPAGLNGGTLDLGGVTLVLGEEQPLLSIPRGKRLVRDARLNAILAEQLGQYASVLFGDVQQAGGTLNVTADRVVLLPVTDLASVGAARPASLQFEVQNLELTSPIVDAVNGLVQIAATTKNLTEGGRPEDALLRLLQGGQNPLEGLLGQQARAAGGKPVALLGGLQASIPSAAVTLKDGRSVSTLTLNVGGRFGGDEISLPIVLSSDIDLATLTLRDASLALPAGAVGGELGQLLRGRGIELPITGSLTAPSVDLAPLTRQLLEGALRREGRPAEGEAQAGQGQAGQGQEGEAQEGEARPAPRRPEEQLVEDILGQLLGGRKKRE
ncbi:MAG: hypothetical protein ACFCVE_07155 [Phycisphaerae bacterium]